MRNGDEEALAIETDGRVVAPVGDVDLESAPTLASALVCCAGDVVLDLGLVEFMDSTGLRMLVMAQQELHGRGARLVLRQPTEPVRRLLELTGLDSTFEIAEV